jgi:hypothetical protein
MFQLKYDVLQAFTMVVLLRAFGLVPFSFIVLSIFLSMNTCDASCIVLKKIVLNVGKLMLD